jgi:hypothetical protein
MNRSSSRWAPAETDRLRHAAGKRMTAAAVARQLGRSSKSVYSKGRGMGIAFAPAPRNRFSRRPARSGSEKAALLSLVQQQLSANAVLRQPHACPDDAWARYLTAYVAKTALNWSRRECADLVGRSKSLITHAMRIVEDARDKPAFDEAMEELTGRAQQL